MANKIYQNDVGTIFLIDVGADISTATIVSLKVRKPSLVEETWVGTIEGTTQIKYVAGVGDLDETGTYKLQAFVSLPVWTGKGETCKFKVYKDYD